ncbi:MAG TPA: hypothetical protein VH054_04430 [Polyangiaceae bacterium]|jgi:hypothetical protein|nr:hypothetical protein [Polyangiaceae bacterium]
MKTKVDDRLVEESARFALRHRCEDCVHWDGARCGDAWPTEPHRVPVVRDAIVVFCKGFEGA